MIDSNAKKLKEAMNKLDIFCITGDGVSVKVQKEADVPNADLLIACASTDELNMLSCLIARRLGAKHTIARVRNPIYYQQIDILKEDLRLSMAVNPELTVAGEISRVLIFPEVSKMETFMKGRVELVEFTLGENNVVVGKSLAEVYKAYKIKILVCSVQRGDEVFIPDGEFVLQAEDKLHIAASHNEIEDFFKKIGNRKNKVKKVMICGGGHVGYYLAKQLSMLGMQVKIIEMNYERCETLLELLPDDVTVINGDGTDHELLDEEGLEDTDAFVSLTGMDEGNIITALYAKTKGVEKIVAKVNEDSRAQMVEKLGITSLVSTKSATADAILSYVRARQNSYASANVETMYRLVDGKVDALEFIIKQEASYTGIPLKDLQTKENTLIACIGRKRKTIIPHGKDCILPGDSVIIVTKDTKIQDIKDIFI